MKGENVARVENCGNFIRSPITLYNRMLIGDIEKYQVMFLDEDVKHIISITSGRKNIANGKVSFFFTRLEPFKCLRGGIYNSFGTAL